MGVDARGERGTLAEPAEIDTDVRIIVVDDDRANAQLLRRMLERAGHSGVIATEDPNHAIELCAAEPTDLLLLDLHLDGVDGYDVMAAVRERVPDLAIILVTGDATRGVHERALAAGAASILVKPFEYADLLDQVSAQLGRER